MRVLLVHNYYRSGHPGGEDLVFEQEKRLLESAGFEVYPYVRHNDEYKDSSALNKLKVLWDLQRSGRSTRDIRGLISRVRPQIAHFHNIFPLISASAYYACASEGIPIVQTVHNYRIFCASGNFFRAGSVCELCGNGNTLPAVLNACYRESHPASAAVALMILRNNFSAVYSSVVTRFIALTNFSAKKLISYGIPGERVVIKPNFVDIPARRPLPIAARREYFLFVGRISAEKGIETLLSAWTQLRDFQLMIVGDGPLMNWARAYVEKNDLPVKFAGKKTREEVRELMAECRAVVFPSLWFEGMPLTILEAWAAGSPVISSSIGSMTEMLENGEDALLFRPGDATDLARCVRTLADSEVLRAELASNGLFKVRAQYGSDRAISALREIYLAVAGEK
jgi:glycosyltransferase involved in cell wall biosynthesis